jgi:hypothetical protein
VAGALTGGKHELIADPGMTEEEARRNLELSGGIVGGA